MSVAPTDTATTGVAPAPVRIRRAGMADLAAVATLFDAYRVFYGRPSDPAAARRFVGARLEAADSVILLADADGTAAGFVQLYPGFSSVAMARIFVLNDLYVVPAMRGTGTGRALIDAAAAHGRAAGAIRLSLSTQVANTRARGVYEAGGWQRDDQFLTYTLQLAS